MDGSIYWKARPKDLASACPPPAYPVPSRLSSMNPLEVVAFLVSVAFEVVSLTLTSQAAQVPVLRESESTHVPLHGFRQLISRARKFVKVTDHKTCPQGRKTYALMMLVKDRRHVQHKNGSSSFGFVGAPSIVDEAVANLTSVSDLSVTGCGGSAALHSVVSLTSSISFEGPASGVKEGSQNAGNLALRFWICSSIKRDQRTEALILRC